jgi:hypothetical protein
MPVGQRVKFLAPPVGSKQEKSQNAPEQINHKSPSDLILVAALNLINLFIV